MNPNNLKTNNTFRNISLNQNNKNNQRILNGINYYHLSPIETHYLASIVFKNKINLIIKSFRYFLLLKNSNSIIRRTNNEKTIFFKNSNILNNGIIPLQEGKYIGDYQNNKKMVLE